MDSYESTKTVLSRIQSWDPENASKIKGYLLKQNQGDEEMIRLGLLSNCSSAPSTPPFSSVSNANKFNPFPQSSPRIMIPNNGFHSSPSSSPWSGGHCRFFQEVLDQCRMLLLWMVQGICCCFSAYGFWRSSSICLQQMHEYFQWGLDTKILFIPCQMFTAGLIFGLLTGVWRCRASCLFNISPCFNSTSFHSWFRRTTSPCIFHESCCVLKYWSGNFRYWKRQWYMPARKSMDEKMIVPCITFWTVGTDSLSVPWSTSFPWGYTISYSSVLNFFKNLLHGLEFAQINWCTEFRWGVGSTI